jgi:WD40 repeat protein
MQGGLGNGINCVAYSADGTKIAVTNNIGVCDVLILRASDGALLQTLQPGTGGIAAVAFSPDGSDIALVGNNGSASLWKAATGFLAHTLATQITTVTALAFSADSTRLAICGTGSTFHGYELWSGAHGTLISSQQTTATTVNTVAISPDNRIVAVGGTYVDGGSNTHGEVELWKSLTGAFVHTLDIGANNGVNGVAWSRDGGSLAVVGSNVQIWNASNYKLTTTLVTGVSALSAAYSADGKTLAVGGWFGLLDLWSVSGYTPQTAPATDCHTVECVTFSPDSSQLLVSGWLNSGCGVIEEDSTASNSLLNRFTGSAQLVYGIAFTPDGSNVISGGAGFTGGVVQSWAAADGAPGQSYATNATTVSSVAVSVDGSNLAIGGNANGSSGVEELWSISGDDLLSTLTTSATKINAESYSPNGAMLAAGGYTGTTGVLEIRSAADGSLKGSLATSAATVLSLGWSPDSTLLAVGGTDASSHGVIEIWNVGTGTLVTSLPTQIGLVYGVAISPNGATLTATGAYRSELWNLTNNSLINGSWTTPPGYCVAYSPDGATVFTGTTGGILVYSTADFSLKTTYALEAGNGVLSIAFSPDGASFAYGRADGVVVKAKNSYYVAPQLALLSVTTTSVKGGTGAAVTVNLSGPAPIGGAVVSLTTSDSTVAPLPQPTITVPAGSKSATFTINTTEPASKTVTVNLTATYKGITKSTWFVVKH